MAFLAYNGSLLPADQPLFPATNAAFRYGEGLFETMLARNGSLPFAPFHFERLFSGMNFLEMPQRFTIYAIQEQVSELCAANGCSASARVRLTVFREGEDTGYLVEATPQEGSFAQWKTEGHRLTLYPFIRRSCDAFSNLKSANYLPYLLAGRYARSGGFTEAVLLNTEGKLADAAAANIFLVKDGALYTPDLRQGCVAGVMRAFVIGEAKKKGYTVHQHPLDEATLLAADEVFLTNALRGIQWVASYRDRRYESPVTQALNHDLFSTFSD